jgi:hypothetical protein
MIALDFDGVVANYGDHTTDFRLNDGLIALLPRKRQPVAICTNQGGMVFSRSNLAKYPSPERVAYRLAAGSNFPAQARLPCASYLCVGVPPESRRRRHPGGSGDSASPPAKVRPDLVRLHDRARQEAPPAHAAGGGRNLLLWRQPGRCAGSRGSWRAVRRRAEVPLTPPNGTKSLRLSFVQTY